MGKGSGRRPTFVPDEQFENNWERSFGRVKSDPEMLDDGAKIIVDYDRWMELHRIERAAKVVAGKGYGGCTLAEWQSFVATVEKAH